MLRNVDHVSVTERLHRDAGAKRAAGEPLHFPIPVHQSGELKARYFFGDEFLIGIVPRHPAETPGFRWLRRPRRGEGERRH